MTAGSRTCARRISPAQAGRPAALPDRDQAADERAHHAVAEGVGPDRRDREAGCVARPRSGRAACGSWSLPRAACRTTRSRARRRAAPTPRSSRPGRAAAARPARARASAGRRLRERRRSGRRSAATARRSGRRSRPRASTTRRTRTSAARMPLSRRSSASSGGSVERPADAASASSSTSTCTTWPRAWTPVSVRPAQTRPTSGPAARSRAPSCSSPWTVRSPGWAAQPWKSVPS